MWSNVQSRSRARGFTLAEVLAALLFMAILIPVTMQAVSVASRAGVLGQRKATAMRIAERVLDEQIVSGLIGSATPYGTIVEGDISYPWTIQSDAWTEDPTTGINVITVRVEFDVQGTTYNVAASTLHDPSVTTTTSTSTATVAATTP
jgi:type II secretory pathway pseudopilin PulG